MKGFILSSTRTNWNKEVKTIQVTLMTYWEMRIGLRMPPDHSILLSVIFRLYQFLVHLDRSPFKLQPSSSSRIGWEPNLVANLTCKSLTEVRMTFSRHPSAEDGDTKLWLTRSTMDVSPGQRKSSASCRVPRFQLCFRLQRFPFLCFIRCDDDLRTAGSTDVHRMSVSL